MPFFVEQQIGMAPGVSGLDGTTAQSHTALVSCACTHGFGFIMAVSYPLCIPRQCAHTLKHLPLCCSQKIFRYRPSVRPLNLMSLTCGACPTTLAPAGTLIRSQPDCIYDTRLNVISWVMTLVGGYCEGCWFIRVVERWPIC